jgi:hypothetical protein
MAGHRRGSESDRRFFDGFTRSVRVMDLTEFASSASSDAIATAEVVIYYIWRSVPLTLVDEPWRELSENV